VSNVTDMSFIFSGAVAFNKPLGAWNVSNVTDMSYMFDGAVAFNQPMSAWNVSNVRSMVYMFSGAVAFNQPLSAWNVSNVTHMSFMFSGAVAFNQDLSAWNVSNVTHMSGMFDGATCLVKSLQSAMQVSSFFDGPYREMSSEQRHQVFSMAFKWSRRRAFMLFLVNHGYLHSAHVACNYERQLAKLQIEMVPCDMIFDVEDVSKYICSFL
jgi:surface protein